MLSNAYFLAKFRFDTAKNEPAKNWRIDTPDGFVEGHLREVRSEDGSVLGNLGHLGHWRHHPEMREG